MALVGTIKIASSMIALVNVLATATADIKLKLSPTGTVYLLSDNWSKNFTCVLESKSNATSEITSSNLTFYLKMSTQSSPKVPLPDNCTTQISSTKLVLTRCHAAETNKGQKVYISCRLSHNQAIESGQAGVIVMDQHPPPEVLIAEAEVFNWDSLTFNVNTREDSSRMFTMTYAVWARQGSAQSNYSLCTHKPINDSMLEVTIENPFQISEPADDLIIKVTGTVFRTPSREILETIASEEIRLNLKQFVNPAQVNKIEVLQLESSVTVSFEPPKLKRNITFNIVIKCDKDFNSHAVNVTRKITVSCPPNNDTQQSTNRPNIGTHCRVSKEFTDLPAFSTCTASVRAIPVAGGIWSEWSRYKFETPESIPLRNPEICSNCFSIRPANTPDNSVSDVIVYFTPLSEKEAQGKIVLYRIRIFDKNFSNESFQYLDNTENSHSSLLLRNLSRHIDYEIGIEAKTSKGYNQSPNMSNSIEISLSHVRTLTFRKTFSVVLLNDTTVRTSWEIYENVCGTEMKISLFWCEGTVQTMTCTGVLKFKTVPSYSISDIITFSGGESIFGMGMECDGKSSGIAWNECVHDIDKDPPEPKYYCIPTDSYATIEFDNYDSECSFGSGPGLTVAYRISYCELLDDESCLGSETQLIFNRSAGISLKVDSLKQDQRYRLAVQSVSENNRSSQAVIKTFATHKSEHFASLAALYVVIVTAGLLLVAALTVLAMKCRAHILNFKYEIPGAFECSKTEGGMFNSPTTSKPDDDCSISSRSGAVRGDYERVAGDVDELSASRNALFCGREKSDTERLVERREVTGFLSEDPVDRDRFPVRPKSVTVVTIPGSTLLSETLINRQNLCSEAVDDVRDTSRILPSVFGSPGDNAVQTECKFASDEQQCPHMTTPYEHQESSAEAYSPPSSDYASGNDEYMCVARGNPDSSKLQRSPVPDDSGSGYVDWSARVAVAAEPSLVEPTAPDSGMPASDSAVVQRSRDSIPSAIGSSGAGGCACTEAGPREDGFYSVVALDNHRVDSLVSEDEGIDSLRDGSPLPERLDRTSASGTTRRAPDASMQLSGSSGFDDDDDDPDLAGIDARTSPTYPGGDAAAAASAIPESVLPVVCVVPMLDEYCSGFQQIGGGCSVFSESQSSLSSENRDPVATRPPQERHGCDEATVRPSLGLSTDRYSADASLFACPTDCSPVSESILPPILQF